MGIRGPLLSCFAIFAVVTFAESSLLSEKKEFLMGHDTPVWLAYIPRHSFWTDYIRVYGLFDAFSGHQLAPPSPATGQESADGNTLVSNTDKPGVVKDEVIYPSVLLMMDYLNTPILANYGRPEWHPGHLVIYASAFWNSVNTAMKQIQNPRVSIQIAGIIIITGSDNIWYLNDGESFDEALPRMINRYRDLLKTSDDFPPGAFDIVVRMTDVQAPYHMENSSTTVAPEDDSKLVAASQGPLCELEDKIAGIIVDDRMRFEGVSRVVDAMKKVLVLNDGMINVLRLGLNGEIISGKGFGWNTQPEPVKIVPSVWYGKTCMRSPKTVYPRGEPVAPIHAVYLRDNWQLCLVHGEDKYPSIWNCDYKENSTEADFRNHHYTNRPIVACNYTGPILKETPCEAGTRLLWGQDGEVVP